MYRNKLLIETIAEQRIALQLTRDTERFLIGPEAAIRAKLEGKEATLHYDQTKPLGSLFLSCDCDDDWNEVFKHFEDAHKLMLIPEIWRGFFDDSPHPHEELASEILLRKYASDNPLYKYAANHIWYGYWPLRDRSKAKQYEAHIERMKNLVRPFGYCWYQVDSKFRITVDDLFLAEAEKWDPVNIERTLNVIHNSDSSTEYVIVSDSIVPLIRFYGEKLRIWKAHLIPCKACGKPFLAPNLYHQLCSDLCKSNARRTRNAIRLQNEHTRKIDQISHSVDSAWNNRLNKIRKLPNWTEDEVRAYEIAKEKYQKDRTDNRKKLKAKIITDSEFTNWILGKQNEAEELIQKHDAEKK